MMRAQPISPLVPYTTLFRSEVERVANKTIRTTGGQLLILAQVAGRPEAQQFAKSNQKQAQQQVRVVEFRQQESSDYERRSEEHTSELQSLRHLVCRLLLEKK